MNQLEELREFFIGYCNGHSISSQTIWSLPTAHAYEWLCAIIGAREIDNYMNGFFAGQHEFQSLLSGALPQEADESILVPGLPNPTDRTSHRVVSTSTPNQCTGKDQ